MASLISLPKWATVALAIPLIGLDLWCLNQLAAVLDPIPGILVLASLVAFLLDIPIRWLMDRGMGRGWAILAVLMTALLATTLLAVFLVPLLWEQLNDFALRLPGWLEEGKNQLLRLDEQIMRQNASVDLKKLTIEASNQISSLLEGATSQVITITLSTLDSLVNLLVMVLLSILLVMGGGPLWEGLLSWLDDDWQTRIRGAVPSSFQSYFSGQATIALILSAAQSVAFILLNVPFGLLFGVAIGLASIIPFGGTVAVLGVSLLLSFQSLSLGLKVLGVAFVLGQINDNLIAPRLIGSATGLNPAVVIVALLVGAKVAGFLGLLLAVPTASSLKKIADSSRAIAPSVVPASPVPVSEPN